MLFLVLFQLGLFKIHHGNLPVKILLDGIVFFDLPTTPNYEGLLWKVIGGSRAHEFENLVWLAMCARWLLHPRTLCPEDRSRQSQGRQGQY